MILCRHTHSLYKALLVINHVSITVPSVRTFTLRLAIHRTCIRYVCAEDVSKPLSYADQ